MGTNVNEAAGKAALVHAVRLAFLRARTIPSEYRQQRRSGRLDTRRVHRYEAANEVNIFKQRLLPGVTKVNAHILVDGSDSMTMRDRARDGDPLFGSPTRIQRAIALTHVLVDALGTSPHVRLNVWLHNSRSEHGNLSITSVIRNGKGKQNIDKMRYMTGGGNGDGYILSWLQDHLRQTHRHDEVDLVIVVSDGTPSVGMETSFSAEELTAMVEDGLNYKYRLVRDVVNNLRAEGRHVLSVAIAPTPAQDRMYGSDYVVPFVGDWNALAADFGQALGKVLATAMKASAR